MGTHQRIDLAKEITRLCLSSPTAGLALITESGESHRGRRIGVSGPPGSGKSSLIAALSLLWLDRGRKVGVLTIDPTSPLSGGSILGDRIRMDAVAAREGFYLRSVPSGSSGNGLCGNIGPILEAYGRAGFDDIVLETVGVGQVEYEARDFVDVLVLVTNPQSGDAVQAMKSGISEVADVIVVHKSDLPGAERAARDIEAISSTRRAGHVPIVVRSSIRTEAGVKAVEEAVERCFQSDRTRLAQGASRRRGRMVRDALIALLDEALSGMTHQELCQPGRELLNAIIEKIRVAAA